jgi:hypothetical protein
METSVPADLHQHEQHKAGESFRAPNVKSFCLDKMLKEVVTEVQQVMADSNGAVLEQVKILPIAQFVLNLMEQNGH